MGNLLPLSISRTVPQLSYIFYIFGALGNSVASIAVDRFEKKKIGIRSSRTASAQLKPTVRTYSCLVDGIEVNNKTMVRQQMLEKQEERRLKNTYLPNENHNIKICGLPNKRYDL